MEKAGKGLKKGGRCMQQNKKFWLRVGILAAACAAAGCAFLLPKEISDPSWPGAATCEAGEDQPLGNPPTILTQTSPDHPVSVSPFLVWEKDTNAVVYELEFFTHEPLLLSEDEPSKQAVYRTREVYTHVYNPPLAHIAGEELGKAPLYWRVRSIGFDGEPVSRWSPVCPLYIDPQLPGEQAPRPLAQYQGGRGQTLLYPVYSWAGLSGADSYEVAVYAENPETDPAARPAEVLHTNMSEIYDPKPRIGRYYWRVRAWDGHRRPVGTWSRVRSFQALPEDNWQVAVLGDSISHGGGHYSFNPADFAFSWLSYLDFDALNLSESGDLSSMTLARFDADVLPFHPKYLMIFTGTNSLRAGEDPEKVIEDLETMREKALQHGIRPILLTLPPINPDAIAHVFEEPTVDDWQDRFGMVNAYIRTKPHIDVAAAFETPDGILPLAMALDGLHEDVEGKKKIGEVVNRDWAAAAAAADQEMKEQER